MNTRTVEPMGRVRSGLPDNPDDILDTESMILNSFKEKLGVSGGASSGDSPRLVTTSSSGEARPGLKLSRLISKGVSERDGGSESGYENAMLILMNLKEKFIDTFEKLSGDEEIYALLRDSIHSLEAGLTGLGAEVEPFNPLSHLSGLTDEDVLNNANEVVKNTKNHYSLHKLASIKAGLSRKGVPCISIVIEGLDGETLFRVSGSIFAPDDFSGNEAIDFVNNDGQGLLTIKAVSLGRWVDVSDRFDVRWDIEALKDETDVDKSNLAGKESSSDE